MDPVQYRQASHAVWEEMAKGWWEERDFLWEASRAVGTWLVEQIAPQPGQTILELAAGAGDTGFLSARFVEPGGRLISTDFASEMVEAARRRAAELGLENVEHRVMDAEHMDLDSDSVDGVVCRWGYMLMADPAAALAETRRVLRPGGRLALAVFAGPEANPWAAIPGRVLVEAGHMPLPQPGTPGILAWADPDVIRRHLVAAGFAEPVIEEIPVSFRFDPAERYWEFILEVAGALALVIRELSAGDRAAVREQVERASEGFRRDDAYEFPGLTLNAATS